MAHEHERDYFLDFQHGRLHQWSHPSGHSKSVGERWKQCHSFTQRLPRNLKEMAVGVCLRFRLLYFGVYWEKNSAFSVSSFVSSSFANHPRGLFVIAHGDEGMT
jgi:hypothetical protein